MGGVSGYRRLPNAPPALATIAGTADPARTRLATILCRAGVDADQNGQHVAGWDVAAYRQAPLVLRNHNPDRVVGRALAVQELVRGVLVATIEFAPTARGIEHWQIAKELGW